MAQSNVTDSPLLPSEDDQLGQNTYAEALSDFLIDAKTPTTIAIQGEWGSGKTSLMNTVAGRLCINYCSLYDGIASADEQLKPDGHYIGIWINTWQYSLLKNEMDAMVSIIDGVTRELSTQMNQFQQASAKVKEAGRRLMSCMAGFAMSAAKVGLSTVGVDPSSLDNIGEMIQAQKQGPAHFRRQLQETVNNYLDEIHKHPEFPNAKGFIFFIDDLDRLDPPVAVQILSLLKNLFEVRNCIFVLAIDYEVVVKGLEKQFGKKTEANEREFRSFFDKIIQLTFRMPLDGYQTSSYLKENLKQINFCRPEQLENPEFVNTLDLLTIYTCGKNPRSIKRMLNTLSLIHKVHEIAQRSKGIGNDENILNQDIYLELLLAIVSIQVAYPQLYEQILRRPNLYLWTSRDEEEEENIDIDDNSDEGLDADGFSKKYLLNPADFDIDALVANDVWMKKRKPVIAALLALMVRLIHNDQVANNISTLGDTTTYLRKILEISHVTSVSDDILAESDKIQTFEDFWQQMEVRGANAETIATARGFLQKLRTMLKDTDIDYEFTEDDGMLGLIVFYVRSNKGRRNQFFEFQMYHDNFAYLQHGGFGDGRYSIHNNPSARNTKNRAFIETVDDVTKEMIDHIRKRYIGLTGNNNIGDWKYVSENERMMNRFWRVFDKAANQNTDYQQTGYLPGKTIQGRYQPAINREDLYILLGAQPSWKRITAGFYFTDKSQFATFEQNKEIIQDRFNNELDWNPDKANPFITIKRSVDITNEATWGESIAWLCSQIRKFKELSDDFC